MKLEVGKTYLTRAGDLATVHEVKWKNSAGSLVSFPFKGHIQKRQKFARRKYNIWQENGRALMISESSNDIVVEWVDES